MAAALFGRKDPPETEGPEPSGDKNRGDLEQLTEQLGKLGQLLAEANQKIAAYLARRESQAAEAASGEEASGALGEKIAALAEKVDQLAAGDATVTGAKTAGSEEQTLKPLLKPLQEKLDRIDAGLQKLSEVASAKNAAESASAASILDAVGRLQSQLDTGLQRLADLVSPQEEADQTSKAPTSAEWERAIVGPDLAELPALAFERGRLINGVLEGDKSACALAGQLLVFQSAPAERLPQLLKDIGEAFYRWQPKTTPGTNPVEHALVQWLQKRCEAAGIYNTIALVHPGERFDSARHAATSRGVEITNVHGWAVLRDNGKVYTKAAVSVR